MQTTPIPPLKVLPFCDVSLFVKKQNDSLVSHEDISNKIIRQSDEISPWCRMYQLFTAGFS